MKLLERSYSAKILRPRPVVHAEADGSLIVITTSWGASEDATRLNEDILKYVQAALADVEVTSPFEFLSCLSDEANYLRVAAMISNERLYRADNKAGFNAGLEVLVLLKRGSHIAYAQVGSPHLLIQRRGHTIAPISVQYEASLEMSNHDSQNLPPLPQSLLGVDSSLNIRCGDFRYSPDDELIVYAGSQWPALLWSSGSKGSQDRQGELTRLTTTLVQKNPDTPFWLGLISLAE